MRRVKRATTRRFIAWLTALAMFAGSVLPMHVFAHTLRGPASPGSDFCTTVPGATPAPAAPADPANDRQCAACCASPGGSPALTGTGASVALLAAAHVPALPVLAVAIERTVAGGNARAPPAFL